LVQYCLIRYKFSKAHLERPSSGDKKGAKTSNRVCLQGCKEGTVAQKATGLRRQKMNRVVKDIDPVKRKVRPIH